jgi:hypothetical protein
VTRLAGRCIAVSAVAVVALVAGCSDTANRPGPSSSASSAIVVAPESSTTSSSTTTTSTLPVDGQAGAADAMAACEQWANGPGDDQLTRNATQRAAAAQAATAAAEDPRWQRLADAMTEVNALPQTDVSSDQEAIAERDLATIRSECATTGVAVP